VTRAICHASQHPNSRRWCGQPFIAKAGLYLAGLDCVSRILMVYAIGLDGAVVSHHEVISIPTIFERRDICTGAGCGGDPAQCTCDSS